MSLEITGLSWSFPLYPRVVRSHPPARERHVWADVEKLWTTRAKLVEKLRTQIFFVARRFGDRRVPHCGRRLRVALRLIPRVRCVRSTAVPKRASDLHDNRAGTCAPAGTLIFNADMAQ